MNIKETIGLIIMLVSSIGMTVSVGFEDIYFLIYSGFYLIWSILTLILVELEKQKEGHHVKD